MRRVLLILAALLVPALTLAQQGQTLKFTAGVDRTRLLVGDRLQLNLRLEGPNVSNTGDFPVPNLLPNLRYLSSSRPSTESRMQIINGSVSSWGQVRVSFVFQAIKPGQITIPPIAYQVGSQVLRTNPIVVRIDDAPTPENASGDTAWKPPSDPYLGVKVSKTDVYVGEQVVVTWSIYYRDQLYDPHFVPSTQSSDFFVTEISTADRINPVDRIYGGLRWNQAYLMSKAYYPIKPGPTFIEPLEIGYSAETGQRDFFGRPFRSGKSVSSEPVRIMVKDLPEKGQPSDFTGTVGNFKIDINPSSGTVPAGEQFKFTMTVTGDGHPDYIPKPEIELPEGFELFTEAAEKDIAPHAGSAVGTRTFKMIILPKKEGDFTLPPFHFPYFDPKDGKYKDLKSEQIRLKVTPGKTDLTPQPPPELEPSTLEAMGKDLRYIKPDLAELADHGSPLISSTPFLFAQFAPPLAVAAAFLMSRRRQRFFTDRAFRRGQRALKRSRSSLEQAGKAAAQNDVASAYMHVYKAVTGFIGDRFNLPDQGMTTADAIAFMVGAGVSEETSAEAGKILAECDQARFAPGTVSAEGAKLLAKKAADLIRTIDREAGK